ncbi:MAG: hypothetical protein KIG84_10090 [Bacteroidales bacterium]|nr:hypothetical protein [Bacteroidales bacterium]
MTQEKLDEYYYYEDTVMTPANHPYRVYHADEVDRLLYEQDAEITSLKNDNKSLKAKLEDAGMRERNLKRALYKACANWADVVAFDETEGIGYDNSVAERWRKMEHKCLNKVKEYR